jgi:hypothetical protein
MASADFWPSISTPLGVDSTRQIARSPRVLRTHLHAYARRIYVAAFRTRIGLHIFWPACPATPPTSASCSSRQRFASGFLQIPSRPGHPCLPLTLPRVGCVEDLHLQVSAPCRAHQKKTAGISPRRQSHRPEPLITDQEQQEQEAGSPSSPSRRRTPGRCWC